MINRIEGKLYYSISEVADMAGVEPYVLRFWEKEFPHLRPKKNRAGNRTYQPKDIERIMKIKKLLYEEGYTIDGARNFLRRDGGQVEINMKDVQTKHQLREIRLELEKILRLFP